MVYYILTKDVDPKVVGSTQGLGQLDGTPDFNELNPWLVDLRKSKEFWKIFARSDLYAPKPIIGLVLDKKAKQTDFIGTNDLNGFYVNDRLKSILQSAHLPKHKFLPTNLISEKTGDIIKGYWQFVYDLETGENTVDFAKCEYYLLKHRRKFGDDFSVNIKSYDDYIRIFLETGSAVGTSKLVFNSNFDKELDIFGTRFLSAQKAYISDRLLNVWQSEKITGYIVRSPEGTERRAEFFPESCCELVFPAA